MRVKKIILSDNQTIYYWYERNLYLTWEGVETVADHFDYEPLIVEVTDSRGYINKFEKKQKQMQKEDSIYQ